MKSIFTSLLLLFSFALLHGQPFQEQIKWQNKTRKFITFLPSDYSAEESLPLVINMHPFLTDGAFQMAYTKFNRLADTARVIVVYPYGIRGQWNSGSFFPGTESGIDDVGFLNALIDYMSILYNIDSRRVYATGYSAGGFMSYRLACELTNRIAAIAPVSASMNPELVPICNPARPVPVNIFNGTADAIVPYAGFFSAAPIDDVVALWSEVGGCDADPVATELPNLSTTDGTTTTRFDYTGCDNGAEVILHRINNGGHTWPGSNFPLLGNTAQDIRANDEIWSFFKRHAIPEDIACDRPSGLEVSKENGQITLSWNEVPGIDFYSLIYILPGEDLQFLPSVQGNSYTFSSQAEGQVVWLVRSQCVSGHASWTTIQQSDINGRLAQQPKITAYPNPVTDILTVEWKEGHPAGSIAIVDAMGNPVYETRVNTGKIEIAVSAWPDGIYHLVSGENAYERVTFRKW